MPARSKRLFLLALVAMFAVPSSSEAGWGLFKRRCFRLRPVVSCPPRQCTPAPCVQASPCPTGEIATQMLIDPVPVRKKIGWKIVAVGVDPDGNECTIESTCCPSIFGAYMCLEMMPTECEIEYYTPTFCTYDVAAECCDEETPTPDTPPPPGVAATSSVVTPTACWQAFYADGNCPFRPATCASTDLETVIRQLEAFIARCGRPCRQYQIRKL